MVSDARVVAWGSAPVLLQPFRLINIIGAKQVISVLKRNIRDHPTLIMVNLYFVVYPTVNVTIMPITILVYWNKSLYDWKNEAVLGGQGWQQASAIRINARTY